MNPRRCETRNPDIQILSAQALLVRALGQRIGKMQRFLFNLKLILSAQWRTSRPSAAATAPKRPPALTAQAGLRAFFGQWPTAQRPKPQGHEKRQRRVDVFGSWYRHPRSSFRVSGLWDPKWFNDELAFGLKLRPFVNLGPRV